VAVFSRAHTPRPDEAYGDYTLLGGFPSIFRLDGRSVARDQDSAIPHGVVLEKVQDGPVSRGDIDPNINYLTKINYHVRARSGRPKNDDSVPRNCRAGWS
jgi:hypothetical protein